ncbi:MAG: hypothetical protein JSU94_16190 [Phycisphaerales bacterium]|nr:MAG: hypothetical protein JSU94_16190 [Phycisphaerales bacterium]
MRSQRLPLIVLVLACVTTSVLGRSIPPIRPVGPGLVRDANALVVETFPYSAEITGDNVYIRSGPGTNYYTCGKLNKGDKVAVVSARPPWSRIVPPAGSFSWISMQYVSIDPDNPGTGIVTGDNVRVYAGSDFVRPIHSTTLQGKLGGGDKVKLLGEQKENYYKISPPSFAYLWVSTEFTKRYVAPVRTTDVTPPVKVAEPNEEPNDVAVVPVPKVSVETEKLKEYYELEKKFQAERAKPLDVQDYKSLKTSLLEIAGNKEAGKAARYSEFVLKQVERIELALAVSKQVKLQNAELQKARERIEKARIARLAAIENMGRFAVIGQLQSSTVFGQDAALKFYRILDESGKTVCYARAVDQGLAVDLSKLIGRKVGLVGTIHAYPQTGGALVRFTRVEELK